MERLRMHFFGPLKTDWPVIQGAKRIAAALKTRWAEAKREGRNTLAKGLISIVS